MKKRPNPENHRALRPWTVEPGGRPGWIRITCGWCKGVVYVKRGAWLHGRARGFVGRSCPYCFRAGRIPADQKAQRTEDARR